MSNFDTVAKLFHEHIEYLSLSADAIADVCDTAAAHLANAIVSEKKVFSVGVGLDASTALSFCQLIRDGVWLERPSLPIIEHTATRAEPAGAGVSWVTRELNSLGQPGDVAVIWGSQLTPDDVNTLSAMVGLMGAEDLEHGLALARLAGEMWIVGDVTDMMQMPVISSFLEEHGKLLSMIIVD